MLNTLARARAEKMRKRSMGCRGAHKKGSTIYKFPLEPLPIIIVEYSIGNFHAHRGALVVNNRQTQCVCDRNRSVLCLPASPQNPSSECKHPPPPQPINSQSSHFKTRHSESAKKWKNNRGKVLILRARSLFTGSKIPSKPIN
jgi:hypothetical protein